MKEINFITNAFMTLPLWLRIICLISIIIVLVWTYDILTTDKFDNEI